MDIFNFINEDTLIETPRVINHGFDLYEDLYLMKPFYVSDDYYQEFYCNGEFKGPNESTYFNMNLTGSNKAFYPQTITSHEIPNLIEVFVDEIELEKKGMKGYKLSQISLPENLFKRYSFLFSSQPILQYIMDEMVYTDITRGEKLGLPDHYLEVYPELGVGIRITYRHTDVFKEALMLSTSIQLSYCELYKHNNRIYRTINMPNEAEQEIVDCFRALNNIAIHSDNMRENNAYRELFHSNVIYGGETFDLGDLAAIKLNNISGLHWDIAKDIASKIKVYNPALGSAGTTYNVINSAYNHLLNTMKSNHFYTSKMDILNILLHSRNCSDPIYDLEDMNMNLNRMHTRFSDMSPININFRSLKKQLFILEEYVASGFPIPERLELATGTDFHIGGIDNVTSKGLRASKIENRQFGRPFTESYDNVTNSNESKMGRYTGNGYVNNKYSGESKSNKDDYIYKRYGAIVNHNLAATFSTREKLDYRDKSINSIQKKYILVDKLDIDKYKTLDYKDMIKLLYLDKLNEHLLRINITKNDFYTDITSIDRLSLEEGDEIISNQSSNIKLDNTKVITRTSGDRIDELFSERLGLNVKLKNMNVVKLEVSVEDIDKLVRTKLNQTDKFNIIDIPEKMLNISIDKSTFGENIKTDIEVRSNLNVLSGVNSPYQLPLLKNRFSELFPNRIENNKNANQQILAFMKSKEDDTVILEEKGVSINLKDDRLVKLLKYNQLFYDNFKCSIATCFTYNEYYGANGYTKVSDPLFFIRGMSKIESNGLIFTIDYYSKMASEKLPLRILPVLFDKDNNENILIPIGDMFYRINLGKGHQLLGSKINTNNMINFNNTGIYRRRGDWLEFNNYK